MLALIVESTVAVRCSWANIYAVGVDGQALAAVISITQWVGVSRAPFPINGTGLRPMVVWGAPSIGGSQRQYTKINLKFWQMGRSAQLGITDNHIISASNNLPCEIINGVSVGGDEGTEAKPKAGDKGNSYLSEGRHSYLSGSFLVVQHREPAEKRFPQGVAPWEDGGSDKGFNKRAGNHRTPLSRVL